MYTTLSLKRLNHPSTSLPNKTNSICRLFCRNFNFYTVSLALQRFMSVVWRKTTGSSLSLCSTMVSMLTIRFNIRYSALWNMACLCVSYSLDYQQRFILCRLTNKLVFLAKNVGPVRKEFKFKIHIKKFILYKTSKLIPYVCPFYVGLRTLFHCLVLGHEYLCWTATYNYLVMYGT